MAKGNWKMPEWMEKYREYFNNTGGNEIEDLINADSAEANISINAPLALICVAVEAQVGLLVALHKAGEVK